MFLRLRERTIFNDSTDIITIIYMAVLCDKRIVIFLWKNKCFYSNILKQR